MAFICIILVKDNKDKEVMSMIHNFYIIKKNGICVFHKKFGSLEEEPQSIAGFLTAISMFSKATVGEEVSLLATKNFKFIFKADDRFTFVTFVDDSDGQDNIQEVLSNIQNSFYQRFPNVTNTYESGNLKLFEHFNGALENIITNYQ